MREYRETKHGFRVAIGWPEGRRGKGAGGVRTILTAELVIYLESHRDRPLNISLPIGNTTIKRLRKVLGHHWQIDRAAWWEARTDDLSDMTIQQFSEKHQVSVGAVVNARHALLGPSLRPAGWWRAPDVAEILRGDRSRAEIADELGISIGSVGRLRWSLKHLGQIDRSP